MRSQKQWRWAFANKMPFAKLWAHRTEKSKSFGKLPKSKGKGK